MASEVKDYEICGSYDNQRSSTINAERTVNMFEYLDPRGKRPKSMVSTSGLLNTNLHFSPETSGSRGTFVFLGKTYQVFGSTIFKIEGDNPLNLIITSIGNLTTSTGYVGIDANTFQVIFVDGESGYIYDVNTGLFRQITDSSFPAKPLDVCYLDGFFVVINGDTNQFQLSSFDQGLVWGVGSTDPGSATPVYTFTADPAAGADWLTVAGSDNYQTGTPIWFSITGGGVLPPPLVIGTPTSGTTYYAIQVDATHIRVATTVANAAAGVYINLTGAGSGPVDVGITNEGQLQEAQVTSHPGTLVACRTLHRRLFLFSQNFTEVWENAGAGTNLPFRRNNGLLMEVGTPAIGSVSVGFDRMYFLAQDKDGLGAVMEVQGTEAVPVSNRALDYQLAQYAAQETLGVSHISDARGVMIKENGLIFYRLNFTLANHTFVYCPTMSDPENRRWHEEEVLNGNRHPAQGHAYMNGINYYAAYDSATFYQVSPTFSTNAGEAIRRMRIGRNAAPDGYKRIRIDRFQLDLLQGHVGEVLDDEVILETEAADEILTEDLVEILVDQQALVPGPQPEVFLSISKDGAQSYGYITTRPMGKIGQRTYRTVWRKLGTIPRGQGFIPKIEFYNEIPFIVLGAAWAFEIMPE